MLSGLLVAVMLFGPLVPVMVIAKATPATE
jgi:hypothetical protein